MHWTGFGKNKKSLRYLRVTTAQSVDLDLHPCTSKHNHHLELLELCLSVLPRMHCTQNPNKMAVVNEHDREKISCAADFCLF